MREFKVTFSPEERAYLLELLNAVLKETRIEEHRTRTPNYRSGVIRREEVIAGLLTKLGQPAK